MSRFDAIFARRGRPLLARHLVQTGVMAFTDPDGADGGTFDAIVGPLRAEEQSDGDGRAVRHVRDARFPVQDGLPLFEDPPELGGIWTYAGVQYSVDAIESVTPNFAHVRLVRIGRAESSRPGYRKR